MTKKEETTSVIRTPFNSMKKGSLKKRENNFDFMQPLVILWRNIVKKTLLTDQFDF